MQRRFRHRFFRCCCKFFCFCIFFPFIILYRCFCFLLKTDRGQLHDKTNFYQIDHRKSEKMDRLQSDYKKLFDDMDLGIDNVYTLEEVRNSTVAGDNWLKAEILREKKFIMIQTGIPTHLITHPLFLMNYLKNEVANEKLMHKNIEKFVGICYYERPSRICLCFEAFDRTLLKVIREESPNLEEKIRILYEISSGVEHMHKNRVYIGLLHLSNIVLSNGYNDVKIRIYNQSKYENLKRRGKYGSRHLSEDFPEDILPSMENDILQFGLIMHKMFFHDDNLVYLSSETFDYYVKPKEIKIEIYDDERKIEYLKILVACKEKRISKRIGIKEIKKRISALLEKF